MINTNELRKRMIDEGVDTYALAKAIGKSYSTANSKLKGKSPMTLDEAETIQGLLHIDDRDFGTFFLCHSRIA